MSSAEDHLLPAAPQLYMAEPPRRRGRHEPPLVSRPDATVHAILEAAALRVAA